MFADIYIRVIYIRVIYIRVICYSSSCTLHSQIFLPPNFNFIKIYLSVTGLSNIHYVKSVYIIILLMSRTSIQLLQPGARSNKIHYLIVYRKTYY